MSNSIFEIGDVVKLKSGGPKMTVSEIITKDEISDLGAECGTAWFTDAQDFNRELFFFDELEFANGT